MVNAITTRTEPDLGISQTKRIEVSTTMKVLLADEFLLYTKLRNYHWNVRGPNFIALHRLFEEQYEALAEIVDEVAERIRQYGEFAPGTLEEFKQLSRLAEQPQEYPDWRTMIGNLVADHETIIRELRTDIENIDEDVDDEAAESFLSELVDQHQKMAWMLRMHLEE